MVESDAERFRKEAEECRRLAAMARSQPDKVAWLRLASDWTELRLATAGRCVTFGTPLSISGLMRPEGRGVREFGPSPTNGVRLLPLHHAKGYS